MDLTLLPASTFRFVRPHLLNPQSEGRLSTRPEEYSTHTNSHQRHVLLCRKNPIVDMPEVRDIKVHVTSSEGVELPEWGVHTFRRNHKTSAYIQSKTDMPFRVSITPKMPYIAADVASAHLYETRRRGSDRPGFFQMEDEWEDMDGGECIFTDEASDLDDQLRMCDTT